MTKSRAFSALLVCAIAAAVAAPATRADYNPYITVDYVDPGVLRKDGGLNDLPLATPSPPTTPQAAPGRGQGTGKVLMQDFHLRPGPSHSGIRITKEWGAATPQLYQAPSAKPKSMKAK